MKLCKRLNNTENHIKAQPEQTVLFGSTSVNSSQCSRLITFFQRLKAKNLQGIRFVHQKIEAMRLCP